MWTDSRLALPADYDKNSSDTARERKVEDIWTPPIEGANPISHKTRSYLLVADRNGLVTYRESFDAVLS